ncbi:MAG: NAD-binding protein, partial [Anaerotignaceae bacterium]
MKICHNTLVAQIQNGVNETITLAKKNGINELEFAKAISYGGGQNFYLDGKVKAIAEENYATAFSVENMAKDLGICADMAEAEGFNMPGMLVAKSVYAKAIEQGYAKEDFCATIKAVR